MLDPKIIVALDVPDNQLEKLLSALDPKRCKVKIGLELYTRYGPAIIEKCKSKGFDVFFDLKAHDIPNTVAAACREAAELGVWMMTLHAMGGKAMLSGAKEAIAQYSNKPLLLGITVLTSQDQKSLHEIGYDRDVQDLANDYAKLVYGAGLDGVISSPHEVKSIKQSTSEKFLVVTPGIRLDDNTHDQKRVMTPKEAIDCGSDYLVIGRAITASDDPAKTLDLINDMICI